MDEYGETTDTALEADDPAETADDLGDGAETVHLYKGDRQP